MWRYSSWSCRSYDALKRVVERLVVSELFCYVLSLGMFFVVHFYGFLDFEIQGFRVLGF